MIAQNGLRCYRRVKDGWRWPHAPFEQSVPYHQAGSVPAFGPSLKRQLIKSMKLIVATEEMCSVYTDKTWRYTPASGYTDTSWPWRWFSVRHAKNSLPVKSLSLCSKLRALLLCCEVNHPISLNIYPERDVFTSFFFSSQSPFFFHFKDGSNL